MLVLPFLLLVHELSVEGTQKDVDNKEEAELSTDEFVEGALQVALFPSIISSLIFCCS